ncbi:MAG: universal stress protein, partial [Anaerolineae bacterium]|jgi:nucleotide-binding universal stress UspA family protein
VIEANASAYVKSVAQRLSPNDGPGVCSVVRRGPAADAIVDYARQADVQMIVMASKDYGSTKRRTHGSVAERVVRTAGIPVLLVHAQGKSPCNTRPTACERILVPLDGTSTAEQILTPATAVTRALGCEMILFQASFAFLFDCSTQAAERMAKTYLAGVAERLEREKIKVSTAVETGPVAETITEFADTHQVDMIAMSTHARAGISRFALGSVAAQVRHMASTPIMLVRAA